MGRYFIKRVALALLTLFFIMTLTFVLVHAIRVTHSMLRIFRGLR
ncbi:MAG: hypothetical protein ACLSFO_02920 [Anaerovoracaceae bacterium]